MSTEPLSSTRRVAVLGHGYADYRTERERLAPFGVRQVEELSPTDTDALRGLEAVLVRETPITREMVRSLEACKVIVRYGSGTDNIDLAAATERGIYVANTPGYGVDEVSTHALALALSVARRVTQRDRAVRRGVWNVGQAEPIYSLTGKTWGLVGYGRVARAFRRKLLGLDPAHVLVYDPYAQIEGEAQRVELDELCRRSDVISLHAPLTEASRHLIGAPEFALMKPTAVLVNTSRGGLVDQRASAEALQNGLLFGAGLDVFEEEPVDLADPLFSLPTVVLTDHTAWYSERSVDELHVMAGEEIARVFSGVEPQAWVNRWT